MIRIYFDYISPNAYLAWEKIHDLAGRYGRAVEPVPVLFAALLSSNDRPGPAEVAPLWHWMVRNILRKSERLGIPLNPPRAHPFNPLLALRVSSLPFEDEERRRLIGAIFRGVWVDGLDPAEPGVIASLADGCGLDGQRAVDEAAAPAAKARLREQTDAAVRKGVFGVPTMIVDDELFWGFDDFDDMDRYLAGNDDLPRGKIPGWDALKPAAWRRQRKDRE